MTTISLDDFRDGTEEPTSVAPNYHYTITLKDGTVLELTGYFVINSLFTAVCRGDDGVIYWASPTDNFASVVNNGLVTDSVLN